MELKINIGYQELLELIRQLPMKQFEQLKEDIQSVSAQKNPDKKNRSKDEFLELLLSGPVMDDEQYKDYLEIREQMSQWRKK